MGKGMYKRILCVLLALQMLCTPIAHALKSAPSGRTQPEQTQTQPEQTQTQPEQTQTQPEQTQTQPEQTQTQPEVPQVQPEPPRTEPEQRLISKPYGSVKGGYGLSIHQDPDQNGKKDQRYFSVERADGADQAIFDLGVDREIVAVDDNWRISPELPQAGSGVDQTGRLPDMEFGGWYTYLPQNGFAPGKSYFNEATGTLNKQLKPEMDITVSTVGVPMGPILSVVGHWVPSTDAGGIGAGFYPVTAAKADGEAAPQPLELYTTPLAGMTATALGVLPSVDFSPDEIMYYLRVPAEVEAIDLSFATREPFAAFAKQYKDAGNRVPDPTTSPVRVLVTTGDDNGKTGIPAEYTSALKYEIKNGGTVVSDPELGDTWTPNNSSDNPAHAIWTGKSIPLTPSAGKGQYYNIIQIKVTAPDGETEKSYTFHVQRLTDPVMKLAPGNTPAGMIERDTDPVWAADGERSKAEARDYFSKMRTFRFADGLYPSDTANQKGRIYRGNYFSLAWPTIDYDCDPEAVVAYQDRDFTEPGLTLTDSEGNPVTYGTGAKTGYVDAVRRRYSLSVADSLTPGGVAGAGTVTYTDPVSVADAGGKDPIILAKKLARVGVYDIRYTFADPISGLEYDSEGTGFFQKDLKEGFHRPLLVLPTPGDVDMDGAVTAADAVALKAVLESGGLASLATSDERAALYLYRVCDVDGNGQINTNDVEKLRGGYLPRLSNSATNASDYFYLPLPGGTEPTRLAAPTGEGDEVLKKAKIFLEYLGKNNDSVTNAAEKSAGPTKNKTMDTASGLTLNDVFWVGVRLEDARSDWDELFGQKFSSFTGTITYDAQYVRPVAVLSEADRKAMTAAGQSGSKAEWEYSTRKYNVGEIADTVWSYGAYDLSGSAVADREYTPHYSKALTTLAQGATDGLLEVVFSVDTARPGSLSGTGEGYLFLVPFQLVSHPYGAAEGHFLELGMGMRDLVFTGRPTNARAAEAEVATAWSMQDTIFGNATQNARGSMQYRKGTAVSLKLGEDATDYTTLYNGNEEGVNAVYGDAFTNSNVVGGNVEHTPLPAGLSYIGATATISGTPEEVGTHTFYVGGLPYQIIVEKAPLTVTATDRSKYYGEDIYCGAPSDDLPFTYDTTQIKLLDRPHGDLTGTAAELVDILMEDLTYVPPSRTACLDLDASPLVPVSAGTEVGKYPIHIEGASSANYEFEYVNGTLTVLPRPVVVDGLTAGSVGTVYHDGTGVLENLPATSAKSAGGELPDSTEQPGFTVARAPKLPTDNEGNYNALVLSSFGLWGEDELAILYNAEFMQNQADKDNQTASGNRFTVAHGETERRDVTVSEVRMTDTPRSSNYVLKSPTPLKQTLAMGGQVTERTLEKLKIIGFPEAVRSYTYGQTLNISGSLVVELTHGKGQDVKTELVAYSVDGFKQRGLNLSWVSQEEMDAGEVGRTTPATHGQQLHVNEHSGKYLCVWTEWVEGEKTVTLAAYSRDFNQNASVTVHPKPLTLTVEDQERYYGEPNAIPVFRYDITELAGWDKETGVTGKMEELAADGKVALRDYTCPTMVIHETLTGSKEVDAHTTANSDMPRYIKISGGAASDYTFRFAKNDGSEKPPTDPEGGYGTLYIHPRPIIVETVAPTSVGTIYADTATPGLTGLELVYGKSGAADTFTVALPNKAYYLPGGGMEPTQMPEGMGLTGKAIFAEDTVGLTYNADFLRDSQKAPHFAMGTNGEKEYPVVVKALALDERYEAKNNYRLVYRNVGDASFGYPSARKSADYTSAVGTVRVRPIVKIELTKEPNILDLTYGGELFPEGMELRITYEDKYENDPLGNAKKRKEQVRYTQSGFEARGLRTYYVDGEAISAAPLAFTGEYPVVAKTGQRLTVQGQIPYAISDENPPQLAAAVRAENNTGTLTIRKKPLTLTVDKQFRFYGEGNRDYTFTAQRAELAAPELAAKDQAGQPLFPEAKPLLKGSSSATGPVVAVGETDLAKLDGYDGLKFSTAAVSGSPARDGGYDLTLVGGVADNYAFEYKKATIGVLKRPIVVTKVTGEGTSWTEPKGTYIYTVYPTATDPARKTYPTTVTQAGFTAGDAATQATGAYPVGTYWDEEVRIATGSDAPIPMTAGGLRSGDRARLGLTVVFNPFPTEGAFTVEQIEIPWNVTIRDLSLGTEAEKNYRLVFPGAAKDDKAPTNPAAIAKVDRRNIDVIEVIKAPVLGGYVYGQPLDLTDLTLRITYKKHDTETAAKVEEVSYGQRANIYVSYWPANATGDGPAALPDAATDWQTLTENYRPADTGDHLTIAPVHDDPDFAANGKYLVVSARTHENMDFVEPRQVATAETGVNPIGVAPLQLTYALTAEDKTYDSDRATKGAVELTNAYNKGGVSDVVYVTTGAEYEDKGDTAEMYSDFVDYIKTSGNKYVFPVKDTAKLNFQFIYPNVRYEDGNHTTAIPAALDSDYWLTEQKNLDGHGYGAVANMPVEVRNMVLAGPDAANYTWKSGETLHQTDVLRTTRNEAVEDQAAAPYATIKKATYGIPDKDLGRPTVEVDRHTNAVRVSMPQPLPVDGKDEYGTELHYEYALETLAKTDGAAISYQMGDKDAYQDTAFFGGEPVVVLPPEGYEPSEPPKEPGKDDVIKGQIYLWATDDPGFGLDAQGMPLRDPVPRDAYLWGRVRLAETHNFLPSAPLYTIEDDAPELGDPALTQAITDAEERAQAESDSMTDEKRAADDKEDKDPAPVAVPAAKSYAQRLDLVSTEQKRGEDAKDYRVNTLESVWFTDVLLYEKKEVLDAVTRNSAPIRYYSYFWDVDHSATLTFDKDPLDLSGPITDIEITKKGENGETVKDKITVNENHIAGLFVSTTASGGEVRERAIEIQPGFLDRALGADPVALTVRFTPGYTSNKRIVWTSSNENVATVSAKGVVTFTGVGEAVITATSRYKKTAQITVLVSKPEEWIDPDAGVFDFYKTEAFFALDETGSFAPTHVMTRGELAAVLAAFLTKDGDLPMTGTSLFADVSPDAPYAAAAEKLGRLGVINGIKNVGFAAERTATRAEFIVMLARMMEVEPSAAKGGPYTFKDCSKKDTWAWAYIEAMAALGIAKGTGGGNFSPERPITRAEVAALLARLLRFQERPADWQPTVPTDVVRGSWAYDAILRAVNDLHGPETEKKTK